MQQAKAAPASTGTKRKNSARKERILEAAVKLFSENGYYRTTITDIAREAGVSSGLSYRYFKEKEDILCHALLAVVDTYESEIPKRILGAVDPVDRLCKAIAAYCHIVDEMRQSTALAYSATKLLGEERRKAVMAGETRSNRIIEDCIDDCIQDRYYRAVDTKLLAYQYVLFCHAWALKHWAYKDKYTLADYIKSGLELLVAPHLTPRRGQTAFAKAIANIGSEAN